jgi:hypothetical protein
MMPSDSSRRSRMWYWLLLILCGYAAVYSLALNIVVAVIATEIARMLRLPQTADRTQPSDYVEHAA